MTEQELIDALEQIAQSPTPYNDSEKDIWINTARGIAIKALKEDVVKHDTLAKYKLLVQKYEELELMYAVKITPIGTKDLTWKGWKRVSELRAEINELKKELE